MLCAIVLVKLFIIFSTFKISFSPNMLSVYKIKDKKT
ncbi:MAG: DUF4492 domain-containing protein [Paludibacteraceae bacterium]